MLCAVFNYAGASSGGTKVFLVLGIRLSERPFLGGVEEKDEAGIE